MRADEWQRQSDLPDLRNAGIIALDTETHDEGLHAKRGPGWPWHGGYITGISLAWHADDAIRAIYIPLRHRDSQNFDREQVICWLRDLIASGAKIVTKNGLYDWGWLWADLGIEMPPAEQLEEIDALATMVDENRLRYSLDALCAWRGFPGKDKALLLEGCAALGLIPARKRKSFKPQSVLWQLPAHLVGPYAETDAIRTLELYESLDPVLDREGTRMPIVSKLIYCRWCTECVGAASASIFLPQSRRARRSCINATPCSPRYLKSSNLTSA